MIHRRPTVIQIKAEDDIHDIQPPTKQSSQMTPSSPVRNKIQNIRQMQMDRSSPAHSPYSSEIYNALISSIRDEVPE
jgi:hypothetical protein